MINRTERRIRTLKRLLKGMSVAMLSTHTSGGEIRSRPLLVQEVDEQGWLWFLTDRSSRKVCELARSPETTVVFQSKHGNRFVAVHGTAFVVQDDVKVRRLWNPTFRAWFPKGRRDPEVTLIAVQPSKVDYWMVPRTRLARAVGAARALATGKRYEARSGTLEVARSVA
jgi:general stress protein 26